MKKFFIFLTLFSFATMLRSSDSESDSSSRMNDMEYRVTMLSHRMVSTYFDSNLAVFSYTSPDKSLYKRKVKSLDKFLNLFRNDFMTKDKCVKILTSSNLPNSQEWALFLRRSMKHYARSWRRDIIELEKERREKGKEQAWENAIKNIRAMARSQPK